MLNNLFIRVMPNIACKVLAIVPADDANAVCAINDGAVIDTVDDTAIIASVDEVKLTDHMWEADKSLPKLQIGHEFVRITQ
jgi:hypothetical protein